MFKKTRSVQRDMFRDMSAHVSDRKAKLLSDPKGWHNIFHKEVVKRIDEEKFSVLFCKDNGRPNASLKVLLGMMILKEGNGWSDEQLFDQGRFNIKVMAALGLAHIDDDIPVESTYYDFRRRLVQYNQEHDLDLIKECFKDITSGQVECYNVSGQKIRMDSKLIQSNIAKSSRLELILEAVRKHITYIGVDEFAEVLSQKDIELLQALKQKKPANITYPLDNAQKQALLIRLGTIIQQLLKEASQDCILQRVFDEHYQQTPDTNKQEDEENQEPPQGPSLKPNAEVPTSSIQSVHDPEAAYRSKGQGAHKQQVSGYHANATETCDPENKINLIIDSQLAKANEGEDIFLKPSIKEGQQVLQSQQDDNDKKKITHVTTDGGYDSQENRSTMEEEGMHWNMHNHKGGKMRYELDRDDKGTLKVLCKKTDKNCTVTYSKKVKKYVITHPDQTKRYFTEQQIVNYLQLQKHLKSLNPEDVNLRPNVESTIHQVFHRLLKRQKIKYRSFYKCQMYVLSRAIWTNYRRILKKEAQILYYFLILTLVAPVSYYRIKINRY